MNPAHQRWFYVYLLRSKSHPCAYRRGKSLYIGCTSDLQKRILEHKNGRSYSTKKMLPIELVYFEVFRLKKDAFEKEKHLKYYGSALRNLKNRLKNTFCEGGWAG